MKKKGFTLAEVLVVLTIIGVVATLTVPQVAQNIQDAQFRSAWKKEFTVLDQVTNQIMFDNGGTLVGAFADGDAFRNKYLAKLNYIKTCPPWTTGCFSNLVGETSAVLSDGTALNFVFLRGDCSHLDWTTIPICATIDVDVNGDKGPNLDGKDIFSVNVRKNSIVPEGADGTFSRGKNCSYLNNTAPIDDYSCAMWYLRR